MPLPTELIFKLSILFDNCHVDREKLSSTLQYSQNCSEEIIKLKHKILRAQFHPKIRLLRFNEIKERISNKFLIFKHEPYRQIATDNNISHGVYSNKADVRECLEHFLQTHQLNIRRETFISKCRLFEPDIAENRRNNKLAPALQRIACFLEFQLKRWKLERRQSTRQR